MAKRVAVSTLQASTLDILNVIRQNASAQYQDLVPEVTDVKNVCRVGDVFQGYPALANEFLNALVNRIALVRVKSAVFNNPYARLKKGFIEYGETVEEIFVNIATVREFSVEKAAAREFKRTIPDVRTAFHMMNWKVQYPVTIQDQDLMQAFLTADGVQDLIARIVDQVYTAAEYDEYLLFKYLLIKAVNRGTMKPIEVGAQPTDAAKVFRGTSNQLTFMSKDYNEAGVMNNTPRERQLIFMTAQYNAQYDVDVLAAAFNMDKATFMGSLFLIDSFTTFDNDRFKQIVEDTDMIDEVTAEELKLMENVDAIMVDEDWFQVYDNNVKFTEKYVASGMYWNYFYNTWKTVSVSPYANSIVFVKAGTNVTLASEYNIPIEDKSTAANATVFTLGLNVHKESGTPSTAGGNLELLQTQEATQAGVAVHKYGAVMFPANASGFKPQIKVQDKIYEAETTLAPEANVGDVLKFVPKVN